MEAKKWCLLSIADVCVKLGTVGESLSRTAFAELRKRSDFPSPLYITGSRPSWKEEEVEEWASKQTMRKESPPKPLTV